MKLAKTIILASASPRRKKFLEKAGIKFKVVESGIEERINSGLKPEQLTQKLSLQKAKAVARQFKNALIIAADSVVVIDDKIIGKPKNEKDAIRILEILSGRRHYSVTGFTIYNTEADKFTTKSVKSSIYFNKLSKQSIADYVSTKKPYDKAGAYGIQELPKMFVKKIVGDYDNVVGLPIKDVLIELNKMGAK